MMCYVGKFNHPKLGTQILIVGLTSRVQYLKSRLHSPYILFFFRTRNTNLAFGIGKPSISTLRYRNIHVWVCFWMVVSNNVLFIFTPTWTNDPIWRAYFSDGWFNHQLVICSFKETKYPTQKLFSDRHLHPWYEFQAKKAVAAAKLKALFWGLWCGLGFSREFWLSHEGSRMSWIWIKLVYFSPKKNNRQVVETNVSLKMGVKEC